jgi:hypothetical protein
MDGITVSTMASIMASTMASITAVTMATTVIHPRIPIRVPNKELMFYS